jgi:hypothetical protein
MVEGTVFSVPAGPSTFALALGAPLPAGGAPALLPRQAPLPLTHVIQALCPSSSAGDASAALTACYRAVLQRFLSSVAALESGAAEAEVPAHVGSGSGGGSGAEGGGGSGGGGNLASFPAAQAGAAAAAAAAAGAAVPQAAGASAAIAAAWAAAVAAAAVAFPAAGAGSGASGSAGAVCGGGGGGSGGGGSSGGSSADGTQFKGWASAPAFPPGEVFTPRVLFNYAERPWDYYQGKNIVLCYSQHFVLVRDRFPKGLRHCLVLPRPAAGALHAVPSVRQLTGAHLPALRALQAFAAYCVALLQEEGGLGARALLLGFHSVPSMQPLHLHIVSDDLAGEATKHRRHYQSFATAFFCGLEGAVECLEETGAAMPVNFMGKDSLEALKQGEVKRCHLCGKGPRHGVPVPQSASGEEWAAFRQHLRTCNRQRIE